MRSLLDHRYYMYHFLHWRNQHDDTGSIRILYLNLDIVIIITSLPHSPQRRYIAAKCGSAAIYTLFARLEGKRPDGLTLVPWCAGKPLTWDVTAVSTLADTHVDSAAREAGAPAEQVAMRKINKIFSLVAILSFPTKIAVEKAGVHNSSVIVFSVPLAVASFH